ncbi:hypothetical protein OC861_004165 [Tilletia horrida]|nr:hypothetical protein OC845_001566 [Tilletia horrida]KAK0564692.1 hypothetical protein OC861_004165 [Tilletia horrida]
MQLKVVSSVLAALQTAALIEAATVSERTASGGVGAAGCVASSAQPRVFKGIFVVEIQSYHDGSPTYGYPSRTSAKNSQYVYHNSLSSVFLDGTHYEGVSAYPCDSVAPQVQATIDTEYYYVTNVDKIQTGILRSVRNRSLCLKAVQGFSQAPGRAYYPSFSPCPSTQAALTGNSGEFIWSWAYNSTAEPKKVSSTPARPQGNVVVTFTGPKIGRGEFAFGSFGYYSGSLGPGNEGAPSIVGSQIYVENTVLQLVGAYNGDINKTQQNVYAKTALNQY